MTKPYLLHGEEFARSEAQRKRGETMTKPATPMPFVAVKPTPERLVKELSLMNDQHETWHATRAYLHKLESDRARLIEALRTLTRECEEYSAMCQEDPAPSRKQARSLLRELEGK